MEIKINKEIKDYNESLFFGLSFKQFTCSLISLLVAVIVYFSLKNLIGKEILSWICMVCAAPIAVAGFFKFNGMNLGEFISAYIKSEFLYSGVRVFQSENILYNIYREVLDDTKKKKNYS